MKQLNAAKLLIEDAKWCEEIESLGFELKPNDTFGLTLHEGSLALALHGRYLKLEWARVLGHLRRQKLGGPGDLFAKALRPKGAAPIETVLDLTCGTGRDTLHLYALGLQVTALERDPYLYLLSYFEARSLEIDEITLIYAEASEYLSTCPSFDIIYFDPMYEEAGSAKKRKAAPRKEMQLFYEYFSHPLANLVAMESGEELAHVVELARRKCARRVIVKRPIKGAAIIAAPYSYAGKSTRYDGYPALTPQT